MAIDLLNDKNYTEANLATKKAIFDKHIASLPDYANANDATKNAILKKYGISDSAISTTAPKAVAPKEEEEGLFSKAFDYITDIPVGVYNWIFPKEVESKEAVTSIKEQQLKERDVKYTAPNLQNDLKRDKELFDMFKTNVAFDFEKQGVDYDESILNQETLKRLNGLGYSQQPFSKQDPTLVFKPSSPKLTVQEIEEERKKAAQYYAEKIENLESETAYAARFLPEGYGWSQLAGALSPTQTAEEVRKKDAEIKKFTEEKKAIDEQYKAAQIFQSNKYTANEDGVLPGFIGTQVDLKDAILDPEAALSAIDNSYNTLFKNDEISIAKSSPEAKQAYKKSLIEKAVFTNNEFRENALIELKAMEEGKSETDWLTNLTGNIEIFGERLFGNEEKFLRGFDTLDEEYRLAQQLKLEKDPIIQSLNEDKQYKKAYEESMKEYLDKKKTGKVIQIEGKTLDENWFQSAMKASSALDKSIKKKEEDLKYLENLEVTDTKQFKQFQENQRVLNETGDKTRMTFSILDSVKDFLRQGEKLNDYLYKIFSVDDETVEFRGEKLSRKDIEAAKLDKPLREIDQYYELIPEIGDTEQRVKSTEAEAIRIFDEEGSFSPDIDFAGVASQTVKMAAISRTLGLSAFAEEITAGAFLKGLLGETSKIALKDITKTSLSQLASTAAKASIKRTSNVALGYVLPTNFLMGSDALKRYMQKGYTYDQAWSLATIDNTIEAITECLFPNDVDIVRNSILKGEIKTAEQLAENEIYKGAFQKAYKRWTGNNLSEKLYSTFKAYGPSALKATKDVFEEAGEEVIGEALRSGAYRAGLTKENAILDEPGNFTFDNIANIAVSTIATMAFTGAKAFQQDLDQRETTRAQYQYIVGRNTQPYVQATLDLFSKNEIDQTEVKRRLKAMTEYERLYNDSSNFATNQVRGFSDLKENEKEIVKQKAFIEIAKKNELEKAILETPTEEEKSKLVSLLDSANVKLNDLKLGLYKSEEERAKMYVASTNYFINEKSIKSYSDPKQINGLIEKYESYKKGETNKDVIASYDSAIKLLTDRKAEIQTQQKEELKPEEEKIKENVSKGVVKIKDAKGVEQKYEIGKRYIVGRQIIFGEKALVRFPEVTFLGYKMDENGQIQKDQNGSPIVIAQTVDTKNKKVIVERPVSVFKDYNLSTQEVLDSSSAGRFFDRFKNKKFVLALKNPDGKPNWLYNSLIAKAKLDLEGVDELEGYLSAETENGKPVIYFNFINPKTGKQNYYKLTDKMMDYSQKKGGYLRPKQKTFVTKEGQVIIKTNQYEDLTPEEMEEMGYFTDKELEQYRRYVESEDFSDLKNKRLAQEQRRREYIEQYIAKISKKLTGIVESISKHTAKIEENKELLEILSNLKPLLNIAKFQNIKLDDLAKALPKTKLAEYSKIKSPYEKLTFLKQEIDKRLDRYSKEIEKSSKKLSELEQEKAKIQPFIDQEIAFLEEIDVEELDYTESIVPQLKRKREAIKEALEANEKIIATSRENINALEKIVNTVKEALTKLFNSIERFLNPEGFAESVDALRKSIEESTKAIDDFTFTIGQAQTKNKTLTEQITSYNKLINFLSKLEEKYNKELSGFKKEKIKEFLFAQQKPAPENATDKTENDEKLLREEGSTKKYFNDLFNSTTSFGEKYEQELKDPKNNYANARLDYFLNFFKGTSKGFDIMLLPINKKNAAKYGLEEILYKKELDTDVKLVVVRKTSTGYEFLDMNGNAIEAQDGKVSPNQVIYTSLQKATLFNSKGEPKYNLKDFEYLKAKFPKEEDRKKEIERIANEALKTYENFRNGIVESEDPKPFEVKGISRGLPQRAKPNSEGAQRNPIAGTLLPSNTTSFKGKIAIADKPVEKDSRLGVLNDHNGNPVRVPLGRPIIWDKKTRTFQFADNHKFSKKQKENLIAVIKAMTAEIIENYKKREVDPSVKVVPTKYVNFLSGLVYWRNPSKNVNNAPQPESSIKDNQIWLDFADGEAILRIGPNIIPLKDLLSGDVLLEGVVEGLYHNVNMKSMGNPFVEYYLEKNKITSRTWNTYEDYLLSDKYPDGTIRPTEEIPLTTNLIPNDSPFDENNNFQENYNPQYQSRYMVFSAPELEVKQDTSAVPTEEPVKKETPAPAQVSNKNANTINEVNSFIDTLPESLKSSALKWKEFCKNLKEGVKYSYVLTSPKTIQLNEENPILFTFSVKIDKNGNIKIDSFSSNASEGVKSTFQKAISNFEMSEKTLSEFLNFISYNNSTFPDNFSTFTSITKFEITEEQQTKPAKKEEVKFMSEKQMLEFAESGETKTKETPPTTEEKPPVSTDALEEKKEEKAEKPVIKRGAKKGSNPFRVAKGQAKIKENIEEAKKWFKERFPNLDFFVVEGLIDGVAWGKFVQNGIILSKAAEIGTVYHEAFEVVAGMFLDKRQWEEIKREFKSRQGTYIDRETGKVVKYSKATDHQVKEELAEEYRDYELTNGKSVLANQYKRNSLFRRMWNTIKSLLFGDPKDIKDLFNKISTGKYKDKAPVKWNRPFNLEKSYRIANLQDDLFFYQLNKSLTFYVFKNFFKKDRSFESLFSMTEKEYVEMYKSVKNEVNTDYFYVKNSKGEFKPFTNYSKFNSIDEILDNFDEAFDEIINIYNSENLELPKVLNDIFAVNNNEAYSDKEFMQIVKNKTKDALLAYAYISDNWDEVINKNKEYVKKYKISYEETLKLDEDDEDFTGEENEDSEFENNEEFKARDEYTKDPFSLFLKNTANSKVKLLIATLPVVTRFKDSSGEQVTYAKLNDLGLPETVEFSKEFRKIVSTVIEEPSLIDQLNALKEASATHPELEYLYRRLGGDKQPQEIAENKDLWNLRLAFNQSFNKQRVGFSRLIMRREDSFKDNKRISTLLTNLVDSLESSSYKAIVKRYLNNFKAVISNHPEWLDKETSTYNIPSNFIPQLTRNIADSIPFLEKLGFDFPYDIKDLTEENKKELFEIVKEIVTFVNGGKAKLENLKDFNFSKHVADLARFEYKITKDAGEVQHRNIENMPQSNDISQNTLSIVYKSLNAAKNILSFQLDFPRFNDIFTQNALWRKLYFENGDKNETHLRIESAEGVVEINGKGKHTSKLPYGTRILQEFLYNIVGDSKNFKTPGFYVITPADIKTETVIKWGKPLVEKEYLDTETGVFDYVLRGYLVDEINLARELSKDDRGLKAYQKKISGPFEGERKISTTLRFFNDILSFDYTEVIDNDIDVNDWINNNKERILKDIDDYFNKEVDDTFEIFENEGILKRIGNTEMYDFLGMETQMLGYLDEKFGTNLKESYKKNKEVTISKQDMKDIMKYRAVNYFVNVNEQSKLFFGDIGQFGDLSKRVKSFVSTRETTAYDTYSTNGEVYTVAAKQIMNKATYIDEFGNEETVDITEGVPGYQTFESEFKASTIKDATVFQKSVPYIQSVHEESLANDLFFSDFKDLPKKVREYITETISKFVNPFKELNEADGQAYMTLPLFRQFLHRSTMWDDDLEELYNYHMAYERNKRNQYDKYVNGDKIREIDLKILKKGDPNEKRILEGKDLINYPVIKPIGAGVRPGEKFITTLDKCSVLPIHYKLLEGKPALDMYISRIDKDINYFRFESAHKVGTPAKMQTPYNSKGVPSDVIETDTLSFQDYAIQVETRSLKDKVTRGTQPLKIAFLNLFEAGVPIDYVRTIYSSFQDKINDIKSTLTEEFNIDTYAEEWKNLRDQIISEAKKQWSALTPEQKREFSDIHKNAEDHNKVLEALTQRYFDNISEEFSIVKNNDDTYTISDFSKFKESIVKQLKDRNAAENLLKQLEIEDGKFVQPFDFIIGADKLEPILMSIINKNVIQPKVKGKGLAQIASTFFEDSPRTYVKKITNQDGTFTYEKVENPDPSDKNVYLTSGELLFYGDDYVEENGVARKATEKEIKDGLSKKANFMEIYLPAIFQDTQGNLIKDFNKIDPELLKVFGYRIPVQEMSAMENIRIKGFLPLEYQNGVVVPSAITAKAGSDFDIDKLTMYLYHYYFSATENKVKKIQYLDELNSTEEERYVELVKEKLFKYEEILKDDEVADSLKEQVAKEMKKKFTDIVREKFKNTLPFESQKEAFNSTVSAIKSYPNKKVKNQLLEILHSKESMFDKYETITEIISIEKERQLQLEGGAILNNIQLELDSLFMIDEEVKEILNVLKESSKKTVGYSLMKGAMIEKRKEVLARYIYMYNIPVKGVITYKDFLNLPVIEQNTTKALENKYIDTVLNLVGSNENRTRLVNPNSMEGLTSQAKKMEDLKTEARESLEKKGRASELEISRGGSNQNKTFAKYGSANNNANTRYSFQVGKEGVGIGAVGMTNLSVNQWLDSFFENDKINEISFYFPVNKINGETSINFRRDAKGNWVSNTNSEFINGFVDIAKNPIIIKINGTLSTAGTYLFANKIGIPLEYAVSLMNQPIILDYEKLSERAQSSIGKIRISKDGGKPFQYPALQIEKKYGVLEENYEPKLFSLSELHEMIKNGYDLSNEQKQDQLKLFDLYLLLKDYSDDLRKRVGQYNYDTDLQRSIGAVNSKVVTNFKNSKNPLIRIDTEGTFFKRMEEALINYTSAVQPLFKVYSAEYRKYINPIIENLSSILDKNSRDNALDDVKRGFANYILLTVPYIKSVGDKTRYLQDGTYTLQSFMQALMIETETSVITKLKPLQEKMKNGEIPTNFALQELFRLVKDSNRGTNNLTVFNRSKEPEYIDLMVNSLKELEQSTDQATSQLAKEIYILALLQSGLNQSNVSISQYIPAESFTSISTTVIKTLEEIDPDVLDQHLKNFKKMYYANKWKDPKFTTKVNYAVLTSKNLSANPVIISPIPAITLDENRDLSVNTNEFSKFQIIKYVVKKETEDKDFKQFVPLLFQRVEDKNGSPLLVKGNKGYSFVYKQVTPLGQGQYSLEFTSKSKFNPNVEEDTNSDIIANFAESEMEVITLDELISGKQVEAPVKPVIQLKAGKIETVSELYGVVAVETNPTKEKTDKFLSIIAPQIQQQSYKENQASYANWMFNFGLRWTRKGNAKAPVKIKSWGAKEDKEFYTYDTLDQNGNPLPNMEVLQPIIEEIQNSLGVDMSDYDSIIGNIYLPGEAIATHRDTSEAESARNYPVIVYTIGNNSGINIYENEKNPGKTSFASDKKVEIPTKNGTIYTFGMDGKGRFEVAHDTPKNIKRDVTYPPITLPDGRVVTNYTITLTFRRAQEVGGNTGVPISPKKISLAPTVSQEIETAESNTLLGEILKPLVNPKYYNDNIDIFVRDFNTKSLKEFRDLVKKGIEIGNFSYSFQQIQNNPELLRQSFKPINVSQQPTTKPTDKNLQEPCNGGPSI